MDREINEKHNFFTLWPQLGKKRYNVIGPTGVMVVMHWATNAPLTKIQEMSMDAARMQVGRKIKEA